MNKNKIANENSPKIDVSFASTTEEFSDKKDRMKSIKNINKFKQNLVSSSVIASNIKDLNNLEWSNGNLFHDLNRNRIKNVTSKESFRTSLNNNEMYDQSRVEYLHEIYQSLKSEEEGITFKVKKHNIKARAILVDWILDVCDKFNLQDETFFLTISILDRYLKSKIIPLSRYQLAGTSSLLIACKYEEVFSPEIKDLVCITDSTYSKEEILDCELDILFTLDFKFTFPSSLIFYDIYSLFTSLYFDNDNRNKMDIDSDFESIDLNEKNSFKNLGLFILYLFTFDYQVSNFKPSEIAISVLILCSKIKNNELLTVIEYQNFLQIDNNLKYFITETQIDSIIKCYNEILINLKNFNSRENSSLKEKFSSTKYSSISENFDVLISNSGILTNSY